MTDAEIDALARDILTSSIREVYSWRSDYFHEIYEYDNGELVPVFAGMSPDGYGSFSCEYMPLETIRTLIKECEKEYDSFAGSVLAHEDFKPLSDQLKRVLAADRAETIEYMARQVSLHLIAFFRTRLSDAIEEAIGDCRFIAGVLANGQFAYKLNQLVPGCAITDIRTELKDAGKKAADKKIAWLRGHTDKLPTVLAKRGRGAPVKTEFKRQAEREQFIPVIKDGYRTLRTKTGKAPTKTDVARQLGIGGDPKRGGQSALQVFSAKLKRLQIDYKELAAKIESELDK